jgi:hypothetical protein
VEFSEANLRAEAPSVDQRRVALAERDRKGLAIAGDEGSVPFEELGQRPVSASRTIRACSVA